MRSGRGHSREWLCVWLFASCVAGVALLPYAQRAAEDRAWPNWRFTGILGKYYADTASHLSWPRQAQDGHALFESKFAGADPRGHRVFNLLFLTMGAVGRWSGLGVVAVFHLERTLAAVLVLVAAWWFAGLFFPGASGRGMRWLTLILAGTSAGLWWLNELVTYGTLGSGEPKLVEASTFWSLEWEVVVGPATALMVLTLGLGHRALVKGSGFRVQGSGERRQPGTVATDPRRRASGTGHWPLGIGHWAVAGLATLAQASVHPHDVLTMSAVMVGLVAVFAVTVARGRRGDALRHGATVLGGMLAVASPLLIYHAAVLLTDPSYLDYARHAHQFTTAGWFWDYGLVLVAGAVGAAAILRRRERDRALLVVWPVVLALVMAFPYPRMQRSHLPYGLHIVLCALAARGLWAMRKRCQVLFLKKVPDTFFLTAFVVLAALTNVFRLKEELAPQVPRQPWFIRVEEARALEWLDGRAGERDCLASLALVGAGLPFQTGSRSFVGHPEITPDFEVREALMIQLMREEPKPLEPPALAAILRLSQADYVYVEPRARALGAGRLDRALIDSHLAERVFQNARTAVYRVRRRS